LNKKNGENLIITGTRLESSGKNKMRRSEKFQQRLVKYGASNLVIEHHSYLFSFQHGTWAPKKRINFFMLPGLQAIHQSLCMQGEHFPGNIPIDISNNT